MAKDLAGIGPFKKNMNPNISSRHTCFGILYQINLVNLANFGKRCSENLRFTEKSENIFFAICQIELRKKNQKYPEAKSSRIRFKTESKSQKV